MRFKLYARKVATLILSFIMIFSGGVCLSSASADEEKEVTFRGIPWGSTIEECLAILESEFGDKGETKYFLEFLDFARYDDNHNYWGKTGDFFETLAPKCAIWCSFSVKDYPINVAGYAFLINLYFLPDYDAEEKTIYEDKGFLIQAEYTLSNKNPTSFREKYEQSHQEARLEIVSKLDSLYGSHLSWPSATRKRYKTGETVIYDEWLSIGRNGVKIECFPEYDYNESAKNSYETGFEIRYETLNKDLMSKIDEFNELVSEIKRLKKEAREKEKEKKIEERGTDGL